MSARSPSPSATDQFEIRPFEACSIIAPIASRRRVVSSSRGSQTKANMLPFRIERTITRVGRGRSASDIAVVTSSRTDSRLRLTSRSWGKAVTA
jgi:hypothetical protein